MNSSHPDPPAGYQKPYEPMTAISWLDLFPGEVGLLVGAVGLFGGLAGVYSDIAAVLEVVRRAATLDSFGVYLSLVGAVGSSILFHEGVHVLAARLLGCDAHIERNGLEPHVRLCGGFLSRRADAMISLAPAVVLTIVGLPLLVVVESAFGVAIVATALVTNVAGSGRDIASVLALRQLPPGSLLYYSDTQLAYEPSPVR